MLYNQTVSMFSHRLIQIFKIFWRIPLLIVSLTTFLGFWESGDLQVTILIPIRDLELIDELTMIIPDVIHWNRIRWIGVTYLWIIVVHQPGRIKMDGVNEQVMKRQKEDLLPAEELAWIVMLFHVIAHPNRDILSLIPGCFGILVTKADVLTTCGCIENTNIDSVGTIFLEVKPKTSLVWWDDDYKQVTQIRKHPHCEACFHTTYNNVALLTIEIINTIFEVVEVIPTELLMPYNGTDKRLRDCFIVSSVTGYQTPRLGSLEVEKFNFTVWPIPTPTNDLGTVIIFGSSRPKNRPCGFEDTRLSGSPLMCRRHDSNTHVPVGIYLGLYCPHKFTPMNLSSCKKSYSGCADCFPIRMPDNPLCANCRYSKNVNFEVVLLFDSLFNWMDENTIAITQPFIRKKFRPSRTSRTAPPFFMLLVALTLYF